MPTYPYRAMLIVADGVDGIHPYAQLLVNTAVRRVNGTRRVGAYGTVAVTTGQRTRFRASIDIDDQRTRGVRYFDITSTTPEAILEQLGLAVIT